MGRPGVAHAAAEPDQVPLLHLPEDPGAVGAGEARRRPGPLIPLEGVELEFRHLGFDLHLVGHGIGSVSLVHGLGRQAGQDRADLGHGQAVVDIQALQRAAGHPGEDRVVRVLDDQDPPAPADRVQARRPVVERPGEDHPDDPPPVGPGGRPEQGIDGGAMPVLPRPARQPDLVPADQEVVVGRRHVDRAALDRLAVDRMAGGEPPVAAQDVREHAGPVRRHVQDDEDRRRQVVGELLDQLRERLDPPRGRPDHDDVMARHGSLSSIHDHPGDARPTFVVRTRRDSTGEHSQASVSRSPDDRGKTVASLRTTVQPGGDIRRQDEGPQPPEADRPTSIMVDGPAVRASQGRIELTTSIRRRLWTCL